MPKTLIEFDHDEIETKGGLHEALCLGIHEGDDTALATLAGTINNIREVGPTEYTLDMRTLLVLMRAATATQALAAVIGAKMEKDKELAAALANLSSVLESVRVRVLPQEEAPE